MYIIAESAQASKYLNGKHIGFDNYFNAPEENIEELIKDYKNDGFTVEEL